MIESGDGNEDTCLAYRKLSGIFGSRGNSACLLSFDRCRLKDIILFC